MSTGVLARAALISATYKRGVYLTPEARKEFDNSKLLHFVSGDISRIDAAAQWFVRDSSQQWIGYLNCLIACCVDRAHTSNHLSSHFIDPTGAHGADRFYPLRPVNSIPGASTKAPVQGTVVFLVSYRLVLTRSLRFDGRQAIGVTNEWLSCLNVSAELKSSNGFVMRTGF